MEKAAVQVQAPDPDPALEVVQARVQAPEPALDRGPEPGTAADRAEALGITTETASEMEKARANGRAGLFLSKL